MENDYLTTKGHILLLLMNGMSSSGLTIECIRINGFEQSMRAAEFTMKKRKNF